MSGGHPVAIHPVLDPFDQRIDTVFPTEFLGQIVGLVGEQSFKRGRDQTAFFRRDQPAFVTSEPVARWWR
jgi:hypothetical protein